MHKLAVRQCPNSHSPRPEVEAEAGLVFLGRGSPSPAGGALSFPSRAQGRAPTTHWFFSFGHRNRPLLDYTRPKTGHGHCIVRFGKKLMIVYLPKYWTVWSNTGHLATLCNKQSLSSTDSTGIWTYTCCYLSCVMPTEALHYCSLSFDFRAADIPSAILMKA